MCAWNAKGPRAFRGLACLAFLYLAAYFALLQFVRSTLRLHIPGTHWNWSGKLITIGFSCVILACSPWLRRSIGLRLRQAQGSIGLALIGTFAGLAAATTLTYFYGTPEPFSTETLLFQATMPSLDEELALRGIALAMLESAFGQSPMSCQWRFGRAAFIISLLFGLGHAVSFSGGAIGFHPFPFFVTTGFAGMASLIRTRSGSLLWPILFHSTWNLSSFLVAMFKSQ